ncbi:Bcr/CflA family multidrug efflux MFS transporter [Vibrio sp. JC009]|uniref:Bcr/CflA family multidrug efflux MFS transporter n=1 Tax=Vibrio sp. JC009 TaxID=2912314 RepID=UPI0023B1249E|nr:Bcr/CflA family multidrug efflux MFS transporter [Vibrio sp. JC009]WED24926.1 Bcr/CflA family multidrug efflux MFS transporter [Vibrio sp. JC009]
MTATKLEPCLMIILGIIAGLTPLAMDMYLPAMPQMAADLQTSSNAVQFTLTTYVAGFAIGQLIHGPLSDRYGRRPILISGIALFGVSAICCAFVDSILALTLIRFVQGLGGAAGAVVLMAIIRDMFDREKFASVMSLVSLVMTVAPLIAPMLGGYITVYFGWQSIFILLTLIAAVIIVLILAKVKETLGEEKRQPLAFSSIFRNYFAVLKSPASLGLILCDSLAFTGMFAFLTVGSFVYIEYFGVDIEYFGYLFALNIVTMFLLTTINARFLRIFGIHHMLRLGLTIMLISCVGLACVWFLELSIWYLVPSIMLYIGPCTLIGSNCMGLLLSRYSELAGTASGLAGTAKFGISAVLGAVIAGSPHNVLMTLVLSMVLCALGSTACYVIFARKI